MKFPQTFNAEELSRYSRHMSLSSIGMAGQAKLKSARVLCVGAGGLGSSLLLYLCASGVGTIGIVDNDEIELTNLQRQILYSTKDIKRKKTHAALEHLTSLNPNVNIVLHEEKLTQENAPTIIHNYDIVADGSDNFNTRYIINEACFLLNKPNVSASVADFSGTCSIFTAMNGPCYRCLYAVKPPANIIPNCSEAGVFSVLPGLMGNIQATEIIKLILKIGNPLIGRLLKYDALTMQFQEYTIKKDPDCKLCSQHSQVTLTETSCQPSPISTQEISATELSALIKQYPNLQLIDVREPHEHIVFNIGGNNVPLSQLVWRLSEVKLNLPAVIYCQKGIRSLQALAILEQAGIKQVQCLKGGINAWVKENS